MLYAAHSRIGRLADWGLRRNVWGTNQDLFDRATQDEFSTVCVDIDLQNLKKILSNQCFVQLLFIVFFR